jgi:excisionase family DNA binding protein
MIAPNYESQPVGALSRAHAAKYLGVSTRMLDKYAQTGELVRVKLGTKTVFRIVDLEAFLAAHVQPSLPAESEATS